LGSVDAEFVMPGLTRHPPFRLIRGMDRLPCVYILASGFHGTLYVGVTSNLLGRVWQHREEVTRGFTKRYGVKRLVWFEVHETMESAIGREKTIKRWARQWKIEMIERENARWRDLAEDFGFESLIGKKVDPGSSPG
jgi:putative endonuclease